MVVIPCVKLLTIVVGHVPKNTLVRNRKSRLGGCDKILDPLVLLTPNTIVQSGKQGQKHRVFSLFSLFSPVAGTLLC